MSSLFGSNHTTAAPVATLSMANLKRSVFGVNYYLQKDLHLSRAFYVSAVIQFVFLTSNAFMDKFEWNDEAVSWFSSTIRTLTLHGFDFGRAAFLVLFVVSTLVIVATLALAFVVASSLNSGTVPSYRVSKALRTLLTLSVAFQGPLTQSLLSAVDCNYGGDMVNDRGDFVCFEGPSWVAAFVVGAAVLPLFLALLVSASFMYEMSPRSYNSTSRTVGWIDMAYSIFQFLTVTLFRLVNARVFLAAWLTLGSLALAVALVVFQPFYQGTMNHVRTSFHAMAAWTGACLFALVLADHPESSVISTVYISLLVPVGYWSYGVSRAKLRAMVDRGRAAEVDDEEECATVEEILEKVEAAQAEDIRALTWREWAAAAQVEVSTRFLLDTPGVPPGEDAVRHADRLLRKGIREYPLSQGLVVAYISHLYHWADDHTIAHLLVTRFSKVPSWSVENQFAAYRFAKNLSRARQVGRSNNNDGDGAGGAGGAGKRRQMDVMSWEESQKTLRAARKHHTDARKAIGSILRRIAEGNPNEATVTQRIEEAYRAETMGIKKFQFLLINTPGSSTLFASLSSFLRDVMMNPRAADAVDEQAAAAKDGAASDGSGSGRGSSMTQELASQHALQTLFKSNDEGLGALGNGDASSKARDLICRMRLASVTILLLVLSLFVTYFVMSQEFNTVLLNLDDSGVRRGEAIGAARYAREMHLAALAGDRARFDEARGHVHHLTTDMWRSHSDLVHRYGTKSDPLNTFYHTPSVLLKRVDAGGHVHDVLRTGFEALAQFSVAGLSIGSPEHDDETYGLLAAWNGTEPQSVPEMYLLLENAVPIARSMDYATVLYQVEGEDLGATVSAAMIGITVTAMAVEAVLVLVVFRRAVDTVFKQFASAVDRMMAMPQTEASTLMLALGLNQTRKRKKSLSRSRLSSAAARSSSRHWRAPSVATSAVSDMSRANSVMDDSPDLWSPRMSVRASSPAPLSPGGGVGTPSLPRRRPSVSVGRARFAADKRMSLEIPSPGRSPPRHTRTRPAVSMTPGSTDDEGDAIASDAASAAQEMLVDMASVAEAAESGARATTVRRGSTNSVTGAGTETADSDDDDGSGGGGGGGGGGGSGDGQEYAGQCDSPTVLSRHGVSSALISTTRAAPSSQSARRPSSRRSTMERPVMQPLVPAADDKSAAGSTGAKAYAGGKADAGDAAAAAKEEGTGGESHAKKRTVGRRARMIVMYTACLVLIIGFLAAFLATGLATLSHIFQHAVEFNNADRRIYLTETILAMFRELRVYYDGETGSLEGGMITMFASLADVRARAFYAGQSLLAVHAALLYGHQAGTHHSAEANGWEPLAHDHPFSPFTGVEGRWDHSFDVIGAVGRWAPQDNLLFKPNCLTYLSWRDEGHGVAANARLHRRVAIFDVDESHCPLFVDNDAVAGHGLDPFVDEFATRLAFSAAADDTILGEDSDDQEFIKHYAVESHELEAGMLKSLVEYEYEALSLVDSEMLFMILFVSAIFTVAALQYMVLGRHLASVMRQNMYMEMIVMRLVEHPVVLDARAAAAEAAAISDSDSASDDDCAPANAGFASPRMRPGLFQIKDPLSPGKGSPVASPKASLRQRNPHAESLA